MPKPKMSDEEAKRINSALDNPDAREFLLNYVQELYEERKKNGTLPKPKAKGSPQKKTKGSPQKKTKGSPQKKTKGTPKPNVSTEKKSKPSKKPKKNVKPSTSSTSSNDDVEDDDVEVIPIPAMCVKLKNRDGQKAFVNICHSRLIKGACVSENEEVQGAYGEKENLKKAYSIPYTLCNKVRSCVDRANKTWPVYDIIFNTMTYFASIMQKQIKAALINVAADAIARKFGFYGKDKTILKLINKHKGAPPPPTTIPRSEAQFDDPQAREEEERVKNICGQSSSDSKTQDPKKKQEKKAAPAAEKVNAAKKKHKKKRKKGKKVDEKKKKEDTNTEKDSNIDTTDQNRIDLLKKLEKVVLSH